MAKAINNSKAKLQAFEKANEVLVPVPLSQPTPLINAIAELGNFTPPPPNPPTIAPAVATIPYGYPIIQAQTIESGGLPVQRLETNGLFNLVSSFIKYWSQGGATKFDTTFGIAPGQGYTTGAVLYYADPTNPNNAINGWYTKLNNNADTTFPNTNWKQITNVTPIAPLQLYQQGRLTGISNGPYDDTPVDNSGSPTLYFTPGNDGNLISLYDTTTNTWITQQFTQLSLNISISPYTNNAYDVYVYKTSTGLALTTTGLNASRTRKNGRWVNSADNTQLLVGSINVNNNPLGNQVIQSWYGNRSIFNVYNQVNNKLWATFGFNSNWRGNITNTYGPPLVNGTANTTDGQGRFTFLKDPLIKDIHITNSINVYTGPVTLKIAGNYSILCNQTTATLAIAESDFNIINSNVEMTLNYIFNNSTPNANISGLNSIQKVDRTNTDVSLGGTATYNENNNGLIGEYWG